MHPAHPWEDARIVAGSRRQFEERDRMLASGARRLGWKLGLGAPPALERWQLGGPVAGFLTDATLLESGAAQSVADWAGPVLEAEVAVRVGVDPDGPFVAAVGLAIELADLGSGKGDLVDILAGDVYHRRTILGPLDSDPAIPASTVTVERNAEKIAAADDPSELVGGSPDELADYLAHYLAGLGEELRAGDVIITGSVVPLIPCADGGQFRVSCPGLDSVEVLVEP